MDNALRFYRDLLGLELVDDADLSGSEMEEFLGVEGADIRAVMLSADGQPPFLELFQFRGDGAETTGEPPRSDEIGATHPCFLVEDIHKEYDRLCSSGVRFTRPPLQIDGGPFEGQWILYGYDPDGAVVEFWSTNAGS